MKELPPPEKSRSTIPDMPQKSPIDGGSYTRVIVTVPFRGALHFTVPLCSVLVVVYIPSCLRRRLAHGHDQGVEVHGALVARSKQMGDERPLLCHGRFLGCLYCDRVVILSFASKSDI